MSVAPIPSAFLSVSPVLVVIEGGRRKSVTVAHTPFTLGRMPGKDLVIADPRVSRDHAQIERNGFEYWIVDQGSKFGTFVNGERVQRRRLGRGDRMELGAQDGPVVLFDPEEGGTVSGAEALSQIVDRDTSGTSDLEKLSLFLEAVRSLNRTNVVDEVLVTLLQATQRLTHAERAFVFLCDPQGALRLAAGRDALGRALTDEHTISRSILQEAASTACEFLITDTSRSHDLASRNSILAFDLRTVICIPLTKTSIQRMAPNKAIAPAAREVMGALYLDSHFASREMSAINSDALRAIATEAAALLENAHLVEAGEQARKYQQELAIAASIQQGLMAVTIPEVPYARIRARSVACTQIGGDFYDVLETPEGLSVIVADVCGKGVSAALLASTLQGMVYAQLKAEVPLGEIARSVNAFLCHKQLGEKYATLLMAQIGAGGELRFINCGHVPPLLVQEGAVRRPLESNLPVGLIPGTVYNSAQCRMNAGDRLIIVSDGVTEAANAAEEFYGDERLEAAATAPDPFTRILDSIAEFCGGQPLEDDCTLLELSYTGIQE